jgi:hypothetical protein
MEREPWSIWNRIKYHKQRGTMKEFTASFFKAWLIFAIVLFSANTYADISLDEVKTIYKKAENSMDTLTYDVCRTRVHDKIKNSASKRQTYINIILGDIWECYGDHPENIVSELNEKGFRTHLGYIGVNGVSLKRVLTVLW